MSADKPERNDKADGQRQNQYPEAIPSNYDPSQPQYAQYYGDHPPQYYDQQQQSQQPQQSPNPQYPQPQYTQPQQYPQQQQHQQFQQYPQQQQPQQQQQQQYPQYQGNAMPNANPNSPQQGYTNGQPSNPNCNNNQNDTASYDMGAPPPVPPPATAAYYDYTAPVTFEDVSKFNGNGKWATGMCGAPCKEPCFCISAFFCPCCCTFLQRKKLLMDDWSRYRCCAGLCGQCLCLGSNCGACAPFCMVMETLFCLACSVHGNRFMVMQHYGLQQECCDVVIIWTACILQLVGAILGNDWVRSAADCVYFIVLACILAQNEHQMKTFPYPTRSTMM